MVSTSMSCVAPPVSLSRQSVSWQQLLSRQSWDIKPGSPGDLFGQSSLQLPLLKIEDMKSQLEINNKAKRWLVRLRHRSLSLKVLRKENTFVFRILSIPAEWLLSGCRPCGNIPSPGEPESCDGGEAAGCPCQGERAPGDRRQPLA